MNGFCPIGPSIVTPDEMADPHNLNLKCIVNGVTKQDSNTKQLVFKTEEIVSWCSKFCTLLPGDLILTGTPPGVGCFKNPPEFLKVTSDALKFVPTSVLFHYCVWYEFYCIRRYKLQ